MTKHGLLNTKTEVTSQDLEYVPRQSSCAQRFLTLCSIALLAFVATASASAQSLDPRHPAPLKPGLNSGMVDSIAGTHYWYFYGNPGKIHVAAHWVRGRFDVGQPAPLDIAVLDENHSPIARRQIAPDKEASEARIECSVRLRAKLTVSVAAPRGGLVRQGGDYELTVTGDVDFADSATPQAEPIVRTYSNGTFGAVRFDANGTLEAEDGTRGTWRLFDPARKVYVVNVGDRRFSVKLMPGEGLVDPADPSTIVFREVR